MSHSDLSATTPKPTPFHFVSYLKSTRIFVGWSVRLVIYQSHVPASDSVEFVWSGALTWGLFTLLTDRICTERIALYLPLPAYIRLVLEKQKIWILNLTEGIMKHKTRFKSCILI